MASTYTVNLGIEKIATGEQSGTWGTTTNTNFDLIDQAVNGAVAVTLASAGTSGVPNTLAITDGSTSDGRNKFIDFNDGGDLGATAYVQLTPNDAEKIVHMRNSLSGGRSVIVFQGTYNASNDFEIPNGKDVLLKFDGAGASATVTDVFTDLQATAITTPDLTATTADINGGTIDGVTIGGASAGAGSFTTLTASDDVNFDSGTFFVDASADAVGIGTSSPSNPLEVAGGSAYPTTKFSRDGGTAATQGYLTTGFSAIGYSGGTGADTYMVSEHGFGFAVNAGTTAMTITDGGNVGIGDSSPDGILDVEGSITIAGSQAGVIFNPTVTPANNNVGSVGLVSGTLNAPASANASSKISGLRVAPTTSGSFNGAGEIAGIKVETFNGQSATLATGLYVDAPTGGDVNYAAILNGGNVGVGTSSPSYKLDVSGGGSGVVARFTGGGAASYIYADSSQVYYGAAAGVPNCLLINDGSNYLTFNTNGSERMRIDSSGNVGIGTTSPLGKLAVEGSGTNSEVVLSRVAEVSGLYSRIGWTGANGLDIGVDSGNVLSSSHLTMSVDGSEAVRIDNSGNVGIGTSSPSSTLDVAGNVALANYSGTGENQTILAQNDYGQMRAGIRSGIPYVGSITALDFALYTGNVERMRIDASGNVGIGTTSTGFNGQGLPLVVGSGSSNTGMTIYSGSTGYGTIQFADAVTTGADSYRGVISYKHGDEFMYFSTDATERMRIDSSGALLVGRTSYSGYGVANFEGGADFTGGNVLLCRDTGNVGIGTASPDALLHVNGTTKIGEGVASNTAKLMVNTGAGVAAGIQFFQDATESWIIQNPASTTALTFANSGTERMRIDSSGNVGIGATSPTNKVDILTADNTGLTVRSSNYSGSFVPSSLGGMALVSAGAYPLIFYVNSAERARIDSSGNVGIGTTSPSYKLDVVTASATQARFAYNSTNYLEVNYDGFNVVGGAMVFENAGSEKMRLDTSGNVGIGTSGPSAKLHVYEDSSSTSVMSGAHIQNVSFTTNTQAGIGFYAADNFNAKIYTLRSGSSEGNIVFATNGGGGTGESNVAERMRIDASGRLLLGTTSARNVDSHDAKFQLEGVGYNNSTLQIWGNQSNTEGAYLIFGKSRGTTDGSNTVVQSGDELGAIDFYGADGIDPARAARIAAYVDGTPGLNDMPGRLVFSTSPDGSQTIAERMRINASGDWMVANTVANTASAYSTQAGCGWVNSDTHFEIATTSNRSALEVGKNNANDGNLLVFRKQSTPVGSIGTAGGDVYLDSPSEGRLHVNGTGRYSWSDTAFAPQNDNARDLGLLIARWQDVYATNGTIQTSDANEKQDIAELDEAERRVAIACKGLLRKFRWISSVEEKGDDARIHFGIIAQDLEAAFEAEGLDAGRYAMFIHSTWTDEETGEERSRMGVRYSELLAFIIAAL